MRARSRRSALFHVVVPGVLAALASGSRAAGHPQSTVGLTIGGADSNLRDDAHAAFHLGARADLLLLRSRGRDMAVGPYADVATLGFDTLEAGGGLEWLLPVRDDLPLILGAGMLERHGSAGWQPAAEGTIFFGSRSYNFHSWYSLGAGLFVQGRYGLGDSRQADVIVGLQMDALLVAYPLIFVYEAVAH